MKRSWSTGRAASHKGLHRYPNMGQYSALIILVVMEGLFKGGNGPATQSAVAQDKALDKGRKKAADDAKKAGDAAQRAAKAEANCNAARQNFQIYADGGRIQKLNAQGEREYMTDEEIEAKRVSSRREMEEACKQP